MRFGVSVLSLAALGGGFVVGAAAQASHARGEAAEASPAQVPSFVPPLPGPMPQPGPTPSPAPFPTFPAPSPTPSPSPAPTPSPTPAPTTPLPILDAGR